MGPSLENRTVPVPDGDDSNHPFLPGLRESVPLLFIGGVLLALGIWLALTHSNASIGRFSLEVPALGAGGILLAGGFLGSLVEDEADSPNPAREREAGQVAVPAVEWSAMKAELAALKLERRAEVASADLAPWDEGASKSVDQESPTRRANTFVPSAQDALREVETKEQEIAPRRNQAQRPQS